MNPIKRLRYGPIVESGCFEDSEEKRSEYTQAVIGVAEVSVIISSQCGMYGFGWSKAMQGRLDKVNGEKAVEFAKEVIRLFTKPRKAEFDKIPFDFQLRRRWDNNHLDLVACRDVGSSIYLERYRVQFKY